MDNHDFIGFVPHFLEIKERPELKVFPLNVLFGKHGIKNGENVIATALYEPDLESYKREKRKYSMKYHNVYGGDSWLQITYDGARKSYFGEKFVNDKSAGMAFGMQWNMFFVHFTALGLAVGEWCHFDKLT